MSVLVLGASHRTAPTEVLERLSLVGDEARKGLQELLEGEHIAEAAILSTCNRVEIVVNATTFHGGVAEITDVLARHSGLDLAQLQSHLYPLHEARAVQHVFAVTSGLDSLLVGESQIQGQVREAFRLADAEGSTGRVLGELFRHALRVGRRVRTETGVDRAGRSLVAVGLRLAAGEVGGLTGRSALLLGAGSTGSLAAGELGRAGIGELFVANRSPERAASLAAAHGGTAVAIGELATALRRVDVVISSTSSAVPVLSTDVVEQVTAERQGRPLFILDLGLPRDVEPGVHRLPEVAVADIDTLRAVLADEPAGADVEAAHHIVDEEVGAFLGWQRAVQVAPTVVALRVKAEAMADTELDRLAARLPHLDEATWDEVTVTVRRVVDKLLHAPSTRVKELAAAPGGDSYAEALRELFGLDRSAVEAVSAPQATATPEVPPAPGT